ncbi:MAG TPA: orotidine-5'-phosphate decarboxylase [Terriglobales bacterium]|nr:orotidine-5'-phosphate decarboxylase [Terriglobales bacterium]
MYDPRQRLIVALDVSSAAAAQKIVAAVGDSASCYKVGMQLYTAEGPSIVRDLVASGRRVFLDLKYHDIPNTVAAAVREAAALGVSMLTVHASGGGKMMRAATEAARNSNAALMVLAVTVLTSLDDHDLDKLGVHGRVQDQVLRLAALAIADGCQGVIASAQEASALRSELEGDFAIVTPGVRPPGASPDDQARVVTPAEAIAAGASHIVVGRPITGAADPASEARAILGQISF